MRTGGSEQATRKEPAVTPNKESKGEEKLRSKSQPKRDARSFASPLGGGGPLGKRPSAARMVRRMRVHSCTPRLFTSRACSVCM